MRTILKKHDKTQGLNSAAYPVHGRSGYDLFISYSLKDEDFVKALDGGIKKHKRRAWLHRKYVQPSEEWRKAVYSGIESSDNFAFVISPDSISSQYCLDELAHAFRYNKRLIPILRRKVDKARLPDTLAPINWIDFSKNKEFDKAVQSLVSIFDKDLHYVHEHTRVLTRAIEWEAKGKEKSLLLRGIELRDAEHWLAQAGSKVNPPPTQLQIEYIFASNKVQRRTRRAVLGAVSLALIAVSMLAALYRYQKNQALNQAQIAVARQLAAQSELLRSQGATLLPRSILLAIESMRRAPSLEADMALRKGLSTLPRQIASVKLEGSPRAVVYSPDGKYIVVTRGRNTRERAEADSEPAGFNVWVLNATTGQEVTQMRHSGNVNAIAVSPDGKMLATASADHTACLWDIATGHELMSLVHSDEVEDVRFSADGAYLLAVTGKDMNTHLWEISSGREIKDLRKNFYGGSDAFGPNNKYLITVGSGVLYVKKGGAMPNISKFLQDSGIQRTYVNSSGKYLAAVRDNYVPEFSEPVDFTIWLWDMDTDREVGHIKYDTGPLEKIVFSPTGSYFVALGVLDWEHADFVYKTEGAEQVMRLEPEGSVLAANFSDDSKYLSLVAEDGTVRVIQLDTRQEVARIISDGQPLNAVFSPSAQEIATTSNKGAVQLWSATGGDEIARINDTRGDGIVDWRVTTVSADGKYLDTIRSTLSPGKRFEDRFSVWEIPSGREVTALRRDVNCLNYALSPTQRFVATDCSEHSIRVLDMANGEEVGAVKNPQTEKRSADPYPGSFTPYAVSLDGRYVVADEVIISSSSNVDVPRELPVLVWDVKAGRIAMRLSHPKHVMEGVFSPDGKYLATAGETVRIWDVSNGSELERLPTANTRLEFSPDSELLLTIGEESQSQMWDVKTGQEIKRVNLASARYPILFSQDGKYIAAANSDDTTDIWNVLDGRKVAHLVHVDGVSPVIFSPDGKYLATSEAWGIRDERRLPSHADIWEVEGGREVTHLGTSYGKIVLFTPDGKYLVVASMQSLRIMPWRVDDVIEEGCARLTRNLTAEEWGLYVAGEPYRKTCPNLP